MQNSIQCVYSYTQASSVEDNWLPDKKHINHEFIQVLLLSSKAGGVGLNIIGANRLVLFDPGKYS